MDYDKLIERIQKEAYGSGNWGVKGLGVEE